MSFYKNRREDTCAFVCDECGEEYDLPYMDFTDALSAAKDDGWRAVLDGGEWRHLCEDCR